MPLINHILGRMSIETTGVLRTHLETKYLVTPQNISKIHSKRNQRFRNTDNIKSCKFFRQLFNITMLNIYRADTSAITHLKYSSSSHSFLPSIMYSAHNWSLYFRFCTYAKSVSLLSEVTIYDIQVNKRTSRAKEREADKNLCNTEGILA